MARRREWRARVGLVVGALVAATLIFELAVRIFHLQYNINPNWRYHPVLGWSQVPGGRYAASVEGRYLEIEFNALGFRDEDHELDKPEGTRRVVVIGDSFCEAVQVNLEQTFFKLLEARLNERSGETWEVINLGVGDFGGAQEWIALNEYGFRYHPDVVIQEIFATNDVCNNSIELFEGCKSDNDRYRPYFVDEGGQLALTTAQPARNFLRRHSAAYGVVEHALLAARGKLNVDTSYDQRMTDLGLWPAGSLLGLYLDDDHQPPIMARAWSLTERILGQTARATLDRDIVYIPVVVPFEGVVDGNAIAFLKQFEQQHFVVEYPETRLSRYFKHLGIKPVLLKERFDHEPAVLPYFDGHLNVAGHKLMADALYERFVARNLVSEARSTSEKR